MVTSMRDSDDDELDADGEMVDLDTPEGLIWQLLLLINPGDGDLALQQFSAWQDLQQAEGAGTPVEQLAQVIDWRSGFHVDADDTRVLVQAIDELTARWNLRLDWDGDTDEDAFHADQDVPALLATAFDRLAESGYTLWSWETDDGSYAGWMTAAQEGEAMRELATALEINLCLGSEVS